MAPRAPWTRVGSLVAGGEDAKGKSWISPGGRKMWSSVPSSRRRPVLGRVGLTMRRLWRWGIASSRASWLDALIANGREATAPELCEVRARQLVKVGRRVALTGQIEACVEVAETDLCRSRRPASVWLVDLRAAEVRAAAAELVDLAGTLRSAEPAEPRGVAMVMLLVRDGESPLYVAHGPDDIVNAVNAARVALRAGAVAGAPDP
jgi:hypothetical protein